MLWLWLFISGLILVIVLLLIKIHLLRKSAKEIECSFAEKLITDSNTLIDISSNDKYMCHLANEINIQLRKLRAERRKFQKGDIELKNAVTNVSHDLRTPLTAIYGYLDLLEQEEKSEKVNRYIAVIKNRTEMLKQLTEELFRYSVILTSEEDLKIEPMVTKIIEMENVPTYFNDSKTFLAITYLKPTSNETRGLYLPDCDSSEALEYCESSMPDGFRRIKKMIYTKCDFDDISFSVFSILHELGHWIQYKDFIDKGHTDPDFISTYELQRAILYTQRNNEYKKCKSKQDIINLNTKYDTLYAELPTEKYADDFALKRLLEHVTIFKQD